MIELFEVMGMGDMAIKFVDGGALVTFAEGAMDKDGTFAIGEKIFTDSASLCLFIETYAKRRFEAGPDEVERHMRKKG